MAALKPFVEGLEKELTCSICQEIFTDPKALPCMHSYCTACIVQWYERSGNRRTHRFDCPICKARIDVPDGDASNLLSSFYLSSLLQLLKAMKTKTNQQGLPDCASCEKAVVVVAFCPQCNGLICGDCVNTHEAIKSLRDEHLPTMFIDFKQENVAGFIRNRMMCKEKFHEKNKLEYYCQEETCKRCVCQKCFALSHQNHRMQSLEEAGEEAKRVIQQDMHRVIQLKEKYEGELEQYTKNMERIQNEIELAKKEVDDAVEMICKVAREHGKAMKEALDQTLHEQTKEQSDINTVSKQLAEFEVYCQGLIKRSVEYEMIESKEFIQEGCKILLETPSILSSKPTQHSITVRYIPNHKAMQSLEEIGKIVKNVTSDPAEKSELLYESVKNIELKMENNSPQKTSALDDKELFKAVKTFGEKGKDKGQLDSPRSIALSDNGEIAIADGGNNQIQIFSLDGKYLREFGSKGTGEGQLYEPFGVLFNEDRIIVSDGENGEGRIQEFDLNGTYVRTIYGPKQWFRPWRMCVNNDKGIIAVCCWGNKEHGIKPSIKLFSKQGDFIHEFYVNEEQPRCITYGNGKYFVSCVHENYIGVYNENGVFLYKFGEEGEREGQFDVVRGLAVYGPDMILVCDVRNSRVQLFTQGGQFIKSFGSRGSGVGQMDCPVDVVVTADGHVFVLEWGGCQVHDWYPIGNLQLFPRK